MNELDILFDKESGFKEIEAMNMKLPIGIKMGWKLATSLALGGVILFGASFVVGDVLKQDDDFLTNDEHEQVLVNQMLRYCKPSLLQIIANGSDKGTCHQKMRDMASYMAATDQGEEPPMNEDLLANMSNNSQRLKERVKRNKVAMGL